MKRYALIPAAGAVCFQLLINTAYAQSEPAASEGDQATTRTEHDLLGDKQVPSDAYYGVQTERAIENFQISGITMNHYPEFVDAFVYTRFEPAGAVTGNDSIRSAIASSSPLMRRRYPRSIERVTALTSRSSSLPQYVMVSCEICCGEIC